MPFPSPAGAAASVSSRIGPCRKNSGPNEREPRRIVRRAEDRPARAVATVAYRMPPQKTAHTPSVWSRRKTLLKIPPDKVYKAKSRITDNRASRRVVHATAAIHGRYARRADRSERLTDDRRFSRDGTASVARVKLRRSSHNGTRQKSAVRNRPIVGPPERYRPTKSAAAYLQETVRNSRTRRAQRFSLHGRRQPIIGTESSSRQKSEPGKKLNTHAVRTGQDMRNDPPQSDGAPTARRRHARPTSASRAIVSLRVMGASDPPAGRSARKSNRDRASSRREPSSRLPGTGRRALPARDRPPGRAVAG